MPSARELRAGLVFVEMGIDQAFLQAELDKAQAQVAKTAAEMNRASTAARGPGGEGFLAGSFRGTDLAGSGLKFYVAIQEARVALADIQIFSSLIAGDFEAMRKSAEKLPFFGELVKEMGAEADAYFKKAELEGDAFDRYFHHVPLKYAYNVADTQKAMADAREEVQRYAHGLELVATAQKRLADAALPAGEKAVAEVAGANADPALRLEALVLTLRAESMKAEAAAGQERVRRTKEFLGLLKQAQDEQMKLSVGAEAYAAYQVAGMDATAEEKKELLEILLLNIRTAEAKKDAVEAAHKAAEAAREALQLEQERLDAARRHDEERKRTLEEITRSVETPEEEFMRRKGELDKALEEGLPQDIYERAIRKALEEAAAALPDLVGPTYGAKGTFWGMESAMGMSALGGDVLPKASQETAKNTEKMVRLLQQLRDEGGLVWN